MNRCASVLACVLGCGTATIAQDVTITYSVKWDFQVIQGGGTNTGAIYATIDPGLGSTIKWTTPPGKGQPGILKAFASSIFDLLNTLNGTEGTLSWTIPSALNVGNVGPWPDGKGGFTSANAGQVGVPINPNPVLDNPIKIINLSWTDTGEAFNGIVEYTTKVASSKVFLDIGTTNPIWVGHNATKIVNGVGLFGVSVPAPAVCSLFGAAVLVALRRRRV